MATRNITLYHYTSDEGKKGIEKTEIIKSSLQEGGRDDVLAMEYILMI